MDDGGLIEGGADVRERDCHRGGAVAARGFHRAANAPPLAILAKRACRRDVFGLTEQAGWLALPGRPRPASSHNGDEMSMKERIAVTTGRHRATRVKRQTTPFRRGFPSKSAEENRPAQNSLRQKSTLPTISSSPSGASSLG